MFPPPRWLIWVTVAVCTMPLNFMWKKMQYFKPHSAAERPFALAVVLDQMRQVKPLSTIR